jgi:hypothetical protein
MRRRWYNNRGRSGRELVLRSEREFECEAKGRREEMLRGTARGIEGRIGLGVAKNKLHAAVPA